MLFVAETGDAAPLPADAAVPDEEHEGLHGVRWGPTAAGRGGEDGYPLGRVGSQAGGLGAAIRGLGLCVLPISCKCLYSYMCSSSHGDRIV